MLENKNYEEIKKLIDNLISKCSHGKYIFRGINFYDEKVQISSSLFREYEEKNIWSKYFSPKQAEKEIVEKAKRFFSPNTSNIEILTDLRHYGGKVNFIDFTLDLYVALFFACNGNMNQDGQLVILKSDDLSFLKESKDINYEENENTVALIKPVKTSISWNRATIQKSIFVYAPEGYIPRNQCIIEEIKSKHKEKILEYLKKFHNISSDTIYNDLIGFIENKDNFSSAQVEFYKGLGLVEEKKYNEAIEAFNKAIELEPDFSEAYGNRGNTKSELRLHQEAIADYNKVIELKLDDAGAYYNRGIAKDKLGQYQEAIADFNKAIELKPDFAEAYHNRGNTKDKLGLYQEAIADYNKAIELKPDDAEAYVNRGIAKCELGLYQKAIADFNKAIELEPDLAEAYVNRGIAKDKLGLYQEAIADFNKAIELKPDNAKAYVNYGNVKSGLGQYQEAIADFNKAIELDPDYAGTYYNRGNAKNQLGLHQEAIADYNKAIELDPDFAEAYVNRGIDKSGLGQYQEAIADYNKAIELKPDLEPKLRSIINELKNKLKKKK